MKNIYSKALLGVVLSFLANAMTAQNIVNRINVPEQQPDTISQVAKPFVVYKTPKEQKK